MSEKQDSISCINCHMPEVDGGAEKMDKKARGHHASHKFLGIHDKEFRKKGMDINITVADKNLSIILKNKMTHPLIVQPARVKFLKIEIDRAGEIIWKNYNENPIEDKQGYFTYNFKINGEKVIIPAKATESCANNIDPESTSVLNYVVPVVEKGDKVRVGLYVQLAKSDCAKVISLKDSKLTESSLMKEVVFVQE